MMALLWGIQSKKTSTTFETEWKTENSVFQIIEQNEPNGMRIYKHDT